MTRGVDCVVMILRSRFNLTVVVAKDPPSLVLSWGSFVYPELRARGGNSNLGRFDNGRYGCNSRRVHQVEIQPARDSAACPLTAGRFAVSMVFGKLSLLRRLKPAATDI